MPNQKVVNPKFMVDQFNFHYLLISSFVCKLHELCPFFIKHDLLGIRFEIETRIKWMKKLKQTIMAMVGIQC